MTAQPDVPHMLKVRFHATLPTQSVALFLVRRRAEWTGEPGSGRQEAVLRCGDHGHARAYADAILRESPEGVAVCVVPTPPPDRPEADS